MEAPTMKRSTRPSLSSVAPLGMRAIGHAVRVKTGSNWAKTLPREAGWSICRVEIGEAKGKFRKWKFRSNL